MDKLLKLLSILGVLCVSSTSGEVACGSNQYLPNPDSCSSYYECSNGKPYLMLCPTGEEFNPTTFTCTNPDEAKCEKVVNTVTADSETTVPVTSATSPSVTVASATSPSVTVASATSTSVTVASATSPSGTPSYYCPEAEESSSYLYPNPLSCSSFYICNGGKLQIIQCPQGLDYSVKERVCLYPLLAKCDLANLPTFPNGPTTPAPCQATASTTTSATAVTSGPVPSYYCPEVDGTSSYIYPSPYACSSYYMCYGGKLNLLQCSGGLQYSATDRICTFPALAHCDLNNLPNYPTGPTEATATDNPATVSVGPVPNYYCPAVSDDSIIIYPSPYSCSSYYMCFEGTLYLFQCASGLEYSIIEGTCLFPSVAKCDLNNLPSYPTGYTTTTAAPTNPPTIVTPLPNYYCPEIDTSIAYLYPNPYSCNSYYQCIGGKLHLYQCVEGQVYSVAERACNYPDVAKCDLNNLPDFPTGPTAAVNTETTSRAVTIDVTTPAIIIPSLTTAGSDGSVTVHYECPPDESGTYHRYPGDCHRFVECNYGVAEIQSCPSGTVFSESSQDCDYVANVPECATTTIS